MISDGRLAPSSSPYFEQCSFQGSQIWQRIQTLQTALRLVGRGRGGEIGAGKGRYVVTNPKPTASNAAAFTRGRKEARPREFSTVGALLGAGIRVFPAKKGGQRVKHLSRGQEDPGPLWPRLTPGISLHCAHCAESITWHQPAGRTGTNWSIKNRPFWPPSEG